MRMLNIKSRFLVLVSCILITGNALAAKKLEEFSKTWDKTFTVNSDATLDLSNKYGDVHITTWKQNEISIKVTVTVDVTNGDKADNVLSRITIDDEASLEKVMVVTRLDMDNIGRLNKKLQVDYVVRMPITNNLKLVNKFGDLYINELDGRANLKVAYGNLKCDILNNPNNRIKLSFSSGKCTVGDFTSGSIEMKYSNLSVNKADKLNLDSKFSSFRIGSATTMECESQYDKMEIERVGDLDLEGKFSNYEIGTVVRKLKLDVQYSDCEVERITSLASEIDVESSFGDIELCFDKGTSYRLEAKGEFGDLEYPHNLTTLTINESKTTSYYLEGVVGGKSDPDARVIIASKFGDVELTYK